MKITRTIYGYNYETELSIPELKEAREEYKLYLEYQELFKQLNCYTSFKSLSPAQQTKVTKIIDMQLVDLAAILNITKEEAAKSLVPAVMFSIENFIGGDHGISNTRVY